VTEICMMKKWVGRVLFWCVVMLYDLTRFPIIIRDVRDLILRFVSDGKFNRVWFSILSFLYALPPYTLYLRSGFRCLSLLIILARFGRISHGIRAGRLGLQHVLWRWFLSSYSQQLIIFFFGRGVTNIRKFLCCIV